MQTNNLVTGTIHVIEHALYNKKKNELMLLKSMQSNDETSKHHSSPIIIIIDAAKYSTAIQDFIKKSSHYHNKYIKIYLLKYDNLVLFIETFLFESNINIDVIFFDEHCDYSITYDITYYQQYLQTNNIDLFK
jgi:hypothetical protein